MQKDAIQQDQKVIILDDAIATGGKPHAHLAVAYQHPCGIILFCQMVVIVSIIYIRVLNLLISFPKMTWKGILL